LSHSPLAVVSGKNVTFQTSGCKQGDTVLWFFGGGLAKTPICLPGNWCIGLAQPWIYFTRAKANASGVASLSVAVSASLSGVVHMQSFVGDATTIYSSNVEQINFK
jgi:hypothetical protein